MTQRFATGTLLSLTMLLTSFGSLTANLVQAGLIEDRAELFSAQVREQAEKDLQALRNRSGMEVRVETYPSVPEGKQAEVAKLDKAGREKFFADWLKKRAGEVHAHGLLVLICKDPQHLRIGSGNEAARMGFTLDQRNNLSREMIQQFRNRQFDQALKDLVSSMEGMKFGHRSAQGSPPVAGHASQERPAPPPPRNMIPGNNGMNFVWMLVIVVGGIMLLKMIFGAMARAAGGAGTAASPLGGTGGGFMSGLFGSMAGMWLYDSLFNHSRGGDFFNHHGGSHHDNTFSDNSSNDSFGGGFGSSDGSDFSSSGGDFGGGSDFGGGDSGGGGDW